MCIVLLTTSHPDYALIAIDNRDEYILRPTSKPHWWAPKGADVETSPVKILSSRDLQRVEQGTWLGITNCGNFAVLTNYREMEVENAWHPPIHGTRSRGGMVTRWLAADPSQTMDEFVRTMLEGGEVKGVGGFSLICGKLRKRPEGRAIEPLAIISNRADKVDKVPRICGGGEGDSVYGLSNAIYVDSDEDPENETWDKVKLGRSFLKETIDKAIKQKFTEDQLVDALFEVLSQDTFPGDHGIDLDDAIPLLQKSVFIPAIGGERHQKEFVQAQAQAPPAEALQHDNQPNGFEAGLYGTQRQTIILVDWAGKVTYRERALYDAHGNPVPVPTGDHIETFQIKDF
ncbi:NRDE protein-domain-containing protein [Podospora appendiculata]|uniref:NRDE protein-domain-containing protein n=1 Tax=Podospora appendiculata TaxID=314037 RepID=A0AAE0X0P0_9PEZI|nr:NRDE protein-domain-containing protein [Podospora appendiculata]